MTYTRSSLFGRLKLIFFAWRECVPLDPLPESIQWNKWQIFVLLGQHKPALRAPEQAVFLTCVMKQPAYYIATVSIRISIVGSCKRLDLIGVRFSLLCYVWTRALICAAHSLEGYSPSSRTVTGPLLKELHHSKNTGSCQSSCFALLLWCLCHGFWIHTWWTHLWP